MKNKRKKIMYGKHDLFLASSTGFASKYIIEIWDNCIITSLKHLCFHFLKSNNIDKYRLFLIFLKKTTKTPFLFVIFLFFSSQPFHKLKKQ